MADYDLGTAHGRVVIDYKDKGTKEAGKDLDGLAAKAKNLLGRFGDMAKKWKSDSASMEQDALRLVRTFGVVSGAVVATGSVLGLFGDKVTALRGGIQIVNSLGLALGGIPRGMQGWPESIQRIVRITAAISLFTAATGLLARSTARLAGVRVITGLLGRFGATVGNLAGPLRLVSGLAFGLVTAISAFGLIKKVIVLFGALGGGLTALGASIHVISGLVSSIRDLSGVVGLLPAVVGAAALSFGVFKLGLLGIDKALKAMSDPKKFAEELKKLSPAAQEFVKAIKTMQPELKKLQLDVQEKLFAGLGAVTQRLGKLYLPIVSSALSRVASIFNSAIKDVASFFDAFEGSKEVADDFAQGLDFTVKGIENLSKAARPLVEALYMIWRVGTEVFAEITSGAGSAAQKFADFIKEARASGKLREWMLQGVQAVKDLIAIVTNLGRIFVAVFDGLNRGSGQTFLGFLRQLTTNMLDFLRSADGQAILGVFADMLQRAYDNGVKLADAFVKYILPAIRAFMPFMEQMSGGVMDGLVIAMQILGPLFKQLGDILSGMAPFLRPIVTGMVALAAVLIGLGIAAKIVGGVMLILRTGVLALKGAWSIASFGVRLFTGNLKTGEAAVLRLAKLISGRLIASVLAWAGKSKLLKFGVIAAGVGLVAEKLDEFNLAAAGGDPSKLGIMESQLHNIVGAGKELASGNFSGIFADIGSEWDELVNKFQTGESPIGAAFQTVKAKVSEFGTWLSQQPAKIGQSFQTDFIGFFAGLPAKIGEVFTSIGTFISTKVSEAGTWVANLPTVIGNAIVGLGSTLAAKATEAWTSFQTATEAKFNELGGTVGSLPYRIGVALGSLIGMALKWAIDTWTSFQTGTVQKFTEIGAFVATLPTIIGTALTNLVAFLAAKAVEAWEAFKAATVQKTSEVGSEVANLPAQIGAALAGLGAFLITTAVNAWNSFKAATTTGIANVISFIQTFPARAGAAIAAFVGIMLQKGREALDSFRNSVTSGTETVLGFIRSIPGRIVSAIGNLGSLLVGAGKALINGLLNGIKSAVQAMYDFVSGIAAGIAARKGPITYDRKLLIPAGNAIVQGLIRGMQQSMPALWRMINGINGDLAGVGGMSSSFNLSGTGTGPAAAAAMLPAYRGPAPSGGDGAGAVATYNIQNVTIPAKDLAEMKTVADFFDKVQQKARAGKATN